MKRKTHKLKHKSKSLKDVKLRTKRERKARERKAKAKSHEKAKSHVPQISLPFIGNEPLYIKM